MDYVVLATLIVVLGLIATAAVKAFLKAYGV